MRGAEIIQSILDNEKLTAAALGKRLGLERPQAIYDIINGKTMRISKKMAGLINKEFPQYSLKWLLGEDVDISKIKEKQAEASPLATINRLIEINAEKDRELHELRLQYEHLVECFEKLANGKLEVERKKSV